MARSESHEILMTSFSVEWKGRQWWWLGDGEDEVG